MNLSNLQHYKWLNKPAGFELTDDVLVMETEPGTDLWQRTHYGFRNDNAPGFLTEIKGDFTFSVKTQFAYNLLYDQCGILLYQNSENWLKVSVEYENTNFARLGSVATNLGYSDWATSDIPADITEMWYRLSSRGQDFLVENSADGIQYKQMRILHMHLPFEMARVGVYACSPMQSAFKAVFSEFKISGSQWEEHLKDNENEI
jgi:regulation of enolase protein 1 (concanavalin A-like superfamily)